MAAKTTATKRKRGCKQERITEIHKRQEVVEGYNHTHPEGTWH